MKRIAKERACIPDTLRYSAIVPVILFCASSRDLCGFALLSGVIF